MKKAFRVLLALALVLALFVSCDLFGLNKDKVLGGETCEVLITRKGGITEHYTLKGSTVPADFLYTHGYKDVQRKDAAEEDITAKLSTNIVEVQFKRVKKVEGSFNPNTNPNVSGNAYAFRDCTDLTNVKFDNYIEDIGPYAFNTADKLEEVELAHVKTIGERAFYSSNNSATPFTTIYLDTTNPPKLGEDVFGTNTDLKSTRVSVVVPEDSVDTYKDRDAWKGFFATDSDLDIVHGDESFENFKKKLLKSVDYYEVINGEKQSEKKSWTSPYMVEKELTLGTPSDKPGYICYGWFEDEACTTPITTITSELISIKPLYVKYDAKQFPINYKNVDFKSKDIIKKDDATVFDATPTSLHIYDEETVLVTPSDRTGYDFEGWFVDEDCQIRFVENKLGKTDYADKASGTDINVYAKWFIQEYDILTYDVICDETGNPTTPVATAVAGIDKTHVYGTPTNLVTPSDKTGYTFGGWYADNALASDTNLVLTDDVKNYVLTSDRQINIYAKWTPNQYTITLKEVVNGGSAVAFAGTIGGTTPTDLKHVYNKETTIGKPDARTGYDPGAYWYTDEACETPLASGKLGATAYTDNITLYAKWTSQVYDITYKDVLFDAAGTVKQTTEASAVTGKHTYGTETNLPETATKTGYTFDGWYSDEACTATLTSLGATAYTSANKPVVYGKWIPLTFTINYDFNGGAHYELLDPQPQPIDSVDGYYYVTGSGTDLNYVEATGTAEAGKSYFEKKATYTDIHVYGTPTDITVNPYKKNAYFAGWYKDSECKNQLGLPIGAFDLSDSTKTTIEVYAKWTDETVCHVIFDNCPETKPYDQFVTLGQVIEKPATPTNLGHDFGGWYTSETTQDDTTKWDFATPTDCKEITLYAKWTPSEYSITVKDVKFKNGVAQTPEASAVTVGATKHTYGTKTDLVASNTDMTGYTYGGMFNNAACTGATITDLGATAYTDNITVYVKWTTNTYNIAYKDVVFNSGVAASPTDFSGSVEGATPSGLHTYGEKTELPEAAKVTKSGYTFGGWATTTDFAATITDLGATDYTDDITVYAKWSPVGYSITYKDVVFSKAGVAASPTAFSGEGATPSNLHVYGTTTDLPVVTKKGYTFGGWYVNDESCSSATVSDLGATAYTAAITVYAKWTPITYEKDSATHKIIFVATSTDLAHTGTIKGTVPTSYTSGDTLDLPKVTPATNSDVFTGWKGTGSDLVFKTLSSSNFADCVEGDDIVLYAAYSPAKDCAIGYATDLGYTYTLEKGAPTTHKTGSTTVLVDPTREGYKFEGWHVNATNGDLVTEFGPSDEWEGTKTLYPSWKVQYTVTFNAMGVVEDPETQYLDAGETVTKPTDSDLIADGYAFVDWYEDVSFIKPFDFATEVNKNYTLYAKWDAKKIKVYRSSEATDSNLVYGVGATPTDYTYIANEYFDLGKATPSDVFTGGVNAFYYTYYDETAGEYYRDVFWYNETSGDGLTPGWYRMDGKAGQVKVTAPDEIVLHANNGTTEDEVFLNYVTYSNVPIKIYWILEDQGLVGKTKYNDPTVQATHEEYPQFEGQSWYLPSLYDEIMDYDFGGFYTSCQLNGDTGLYEVSGSELDTSVFHAASASDLAKSTASDWEKDNVLELYALFVKEESESSDYYWYLSYEIGYDDHYWSDKVVVEKKADKYKNFPAGTPIQTKESVNESDFVGYTLAGWQVFSWSRVKVNNRGFYEYVEKRTLVPDNAIKVSTGPGTGYITPTDLATVTDMYLSTGAAGTHYIKPGDYFELNKAINPNVYVIRGVWKPITYTVKFEKGDAPDLATMSDINAKYDEVIYMPECTFARDGFVFDGWRIKSIVDKDGNAYNTSSYVAYNASASDLVNEKSYIGNMTGVSNLAYKQDSVVTLEAQWKQKTNNITLDYNGADNKSRGPNTIAIKMGEPVGALPFVRSDIAGFKGWYKVVATTTDIPEAVELKQPNGDSFSTLLYGIPVNSEYVATASDFNGNVKFVAQWENGKVAVRFYNDIDDTLTESAIFIDQKAKSFNAATGDTSIYASGTDMKDYFYDEACTWSLNEKTYSSNEWEVTAYRRFPGVNKCFFELNGGQFSETVKARPTDEYSSYDYIISYATNSDLPSPTRTGYKFKGWQEYGTTGTYTELAFDNGKYARYFEAVWESNK